MGRFPLGSIHESHFQDFFETEKDLLATSLAARGTVQNTPGICVRVQRNMARRWNPWSGVSGRHFGQLV